jgi:SpoVK/Ycf46/Vps4 family AAA+-type ATPase
MGIFGLGRGKERGKEGDKPAEGDASATQQEERQAASQAAPSDATEEQPQTSIPQTQGPYSNSEEHLWHALAWANALVQAQTLRWRQTIAASKPEQYWGMVHVTDAEVRSYLAAPFMHADELPEALIDTLQPHWNAALKIATDIDARRRQTPDSLILRLPELEKQFQLSAYEMAVLLITLLPQLDNRYRRLYGYLQDDASRTRPNVELVLQMLQPLAPENDSAQAVFNSEAPLRMHQLIHVTDLLGNNDPLSARALHVDTRIVDYLLGNDRLDHRLKDIVSVQASTLSFDELLVEEDQRSYLYNLAQWIAAQPRDEQPAPTLLLHGAYGSGKLDVANAFCHTLGMPLLVIDTRAALRSTEGWGRTLELILREAALQQSAIYWSDTQILRERERPGDEWDALVAAAEGHTGMIFLASETPWDPMGRYRQRPFLRIDLHSPGFELRRRLWDTALPEDVLFAEGVPARDQLVSVLSNGFQLTGGQIADAVSSARAVALQRDPQRPQITLDDLHEGCRRQSSRGLISYARLIEPRTDLTFDDLILPESNGRQLNELRARIHFRSHVYTIMGFERRLSLGKGLITLFTGASGTGKTMAAELLGHEYGMQIYKVDLAAVVSKYVGETEKNLSRVFDEAEDANAILFFDEGEALFGKRGEVKEARDRWANTEVNYLLQRIEEYRGVVIITTNFRQNMDPAFLRRIQVAVDFPRPSPQARFKIMRGMFPAGVQRPKDEELHALATQFSLSGGHIKNAVIDAAFRAMAEAGPEGPQITIRHLVLGIAREEQKMGRALTKGDFGEEYYPMIEADILT